MLLQQLYLWYNSLLSSFKATHHGVAFATASLPIGKQTDIVALQSVLQHLNTEVFIDLLLASKLCISCLQTIGILHLALGFPRTYNIRYFT